MPTLINGPIVVETYKRPNPGECRYTFAPSLDAGEPGFFHVTVQAGDAALRCRVAQIVQRALEDAALCDEPLVCREKFKDASIDDLIDHHQNVYEMHAEVKGQHEAECAAFGDSWPGAAHEVRSGEITLSVLDDLIKEKASQMTPEEREAYFPSAPADAHPVDDSEAPPF